MVATARRSGSWESIGGQLICRGSGFVQQIAQHGRVKAPLRSAFAGRLAQTLSAAKRGASGRVKVPAWKGLTTHHYRVLRLWRSSEAVQAATQANKRGEAYTGYVIGRLGSQPLRAGIASKSRSGLVSVVTCVKPKRARRYGEPGKSRRSSQATACDKRCVLNAGDPLGSCSEPAGEIGYTDI